MIIDSLELQAAFEANGGDAWQDEYEEPEPEDEETEKEKEAP